MAAVSEAPATAITSYNRSEGIELGQLEVRWKASRAFTRTLLEEADLPWAGRRAGLRYSWFSVFLVEGLSEQVATNATLETHPDLYRDLLNTDDAANRLYEAIGKYKTSQSVRKLIRAGTIPAHSFITIGPRRMYRFRPLAFNRVCLDLMQGRLV